ncbi:MAG: aspartate aminotransferase family protein [bacterium JZ-2024 1]
MKKKNPRLKQERLTRLFRQYLAQTSENPDGFVIDCGEGSYVYDLAGNRYLDMVAGVGVLSTGHRHPRILHAIQAQAQKYLHAMVYGEWVEDVQVQFAKLLCSKLKIAQPTVYFTNSGSEAIEGAMKLAHRVTGKKVFVSFEGSYHGDTTGALALCGVDTFREPFADLMGVQVRRLPWNDSSALGAIDRDVAAVFVELVQGEAGYRVASPPWIRALRERIFHVGAMMVVDEVQTGLVRTGKWFAYEHFEILPDVLVLGKALGGGLPLGAFIAPKPYMQALSKNPPYGHITTFGGNPLACAAGFASISFMSAARLPQLVASRGITLRNVLKQLATAYPDVIKEVRGLGLMVGIEVRDAGTARKIIREARHRGVILGTTLYNDQTIRVTPPLTVKPEELTFFARVLDEILASYSRA